MRWGLSLCHRAIGTADAELLKSYEPPMTQADLDTAWAYAAANAQEIEQAIHDIDLENIPE